MGHVKRIQVRDDGYLSLQLQNRSDVDLYMLEQLNKEDHALACVQKKKAVTTFLYDIRYHLPVSQVFSDLVFTIPDALLFLQKLFTTLSKLEASFPLYVQIEHIYMDEEGKFYGVILPIHEHYNEEIQWNVFLQDLLTRIQIQQGERLIGYLYPFTLMHWKSSEEMVQLLKRFSIPTPWSYTMQYVLSKKNASMYKTKQKQILEASFAKSKLHQAGNIQSFLLQKKEQGDTIPLFSKTKKCAVLENKEGLQVILQKENWIGRSQECTLYLEQSSISSHHACIVETMDGYILKDLHSSNGTFLNQSPVDEQGHTLHDGDRICFAKEEWYFYEKVPMAATKTY